MLDACAKREAWVRTGEEASKSWSSGRCGFRFSGLVAASATMDGWVGGGSEGSWSGVGEPKMKFCQMSSSSSAAGTGAGGGVEGG